MAIRRPSRLRRVATSARWPIGIALTSWHYMWRITPLHRREVAGTLAEDGSPSLPEGVSVGDAQLSDAGVGPLYHRRYRARIAEARMSAEELMERVLSGPNQLAPTEFARFTKVDGEDGPMRAGDEYLVRMPGPWDGPVRVASVTPTSFRLITLEGHLEAGQIEFGVAEEGDEVVFTIESWARSGDHLSRFLYQRLRMAKEVQLHMWTSFLERAVKLAGGRLVGGLEIETRAVEEGADQE